MKISPNLIIRDHLNTLRDARSNQKFRADLVLFYALPLALGIVSYWIICLSTADFYNVSITFFGIFVALLLNIQVAVFSIFQRKWERSSDQKIAEISDNQLASRLKLLQEINANISYAVLVSCAALFIFILLYGIHFTFNIATSISVFIYLHFLLTLLMIIKRSHALFRTEYQNEL